MESLVKTEEISKSLKLGKFTGDLISNMIMHSLRIDELNDLYQTISNKTPYDFIDAVLDKMNIQFQLDENELKNIPSDGEFITISNHPYGGLDGLLLLKILSLKRPDSKVLANFLLSRFKPIAPLMISVNPFENVKKSNVSGLKEALNYLKSGHPLSIFPAGEVSSFNFSEKSITDKIWNAQAIKLIKKAEVPVIPIFFSGNNSLAFHILGLIHPALRTARLPIELLNKKDHIIQIRIGKPISVNDQNKFDDINQFSKFLRSKTYSLGSKIDSSSFFIPNKTRELKQTPELIKKKISKEILQNEIDKIAERDLLFAQSGFSVYCSKTYDIPNIMQQIGILREETFREIGEGTNKSIDIDEFDLYYNHLFIWDNKEQCVVGAYRFGKGKEIIKMYGKKGFYSNSLFKIKNGFIPILEQSLEFGRSFIVKEYQRKPNSLFLLWKGILYVLLHNPEYRFLIGPVSISNNYSNFSKSLLIDFITKNHFYPNLTPFIRARNKFKLNKKEEASRRILIDSVEANTSKLDDYIKEIEGGEGIPILIKKYLKLNARIACFNVDPEFNNCVDGFLIADVFEFPADTIKALSKEFNDFSILNRFSSIENN